MMHTFMEQVFSFHQDLNHPGQAGSRSKEPISLSFQPVPGFRRMPDDAPLRLSRRELILTIAIPVLSFGGAGLGLLLQQLGIISDAGDFYWGSLVASFLLAYLAWIKPRKDIVSLLAPLYAVIIFLLAVETRPTVILQLLFAASLTILAVRLNRRFSIAFDKAKEVDPMEKFLYTYMNRITPYFRSVDRNSAHHIASAVLSFKFGIFPNSVASAEKAIAGIKGEGSISTLRKSLIIIRDRAENLQESLVKTYSEKTFSGDDFQYLPVVLPPELIDSPENYTLDNALVFCYAVAYLCSPDDGQMLDEHQNFVIQILNSYKEVLGLAEGQK
jgi:hypothetical protein